jgi:glycosyltransferase involved in cell wall biosynthesis
VILCTYNPNLDLLRWGLGSLMEQDLPKSQFEVIIVDNNSNPPLCEEVLQEYGPLNLRLIRESKQGLSFARCAGIAHAKGDLLIFMDDDNHLDPDFLENALQIAGMEDNIGLFGGEARAVLEEEISTWKRNFLPFLGVRNYGAESITSRNEHWGKWEPIGAGMVSRRDVAESFMHCVEHTAIAGELGRSGRSLMSGEDSLFARLANRLGYACSYQPALKLSHFMKASRFRIAYLSRILEGHGRSFVILESIAGKQMKYYGFCSSCYMLLRRFLFRCKDKGLRAGFIHWFWDYGFVMESRRKASNLPERV